MEVSLNYSEQKTLRGRQQLAPTFCDGTADMALGACLAPASWLGHVAPSQKSPRLCRPLRFTHHTHRPRGRRGGVYGPHAPKKAKLSSIL